MSDTPTPHAPFAGLGLGEAAMRAIADLGYETATEVQSRTIPPMVSGRDIIAQAPTGTGKTAAYGLPIVERLDESSLRTQALVIVPTRELAMQVAEALHGLGRHRQMVTLPIYGGQAYDRQLKALARGVQVVVGTPGRLLDHLNRGTLKLDAVRTVVLDEADEMLNMGFIEDIETMLAALPEDRQTALFSATIPPRIQKLSRQYLRNPESVSVANREATAPMVRQVYYEVRWQEKPDALNRILEFEAPESAIVFVRTRRDADTVSEHLNGLGYIAQAIHGEVTQSQRERVLERFRAGHTHVLVGTDVAARGLDIPDVTHVINYDLPEDAESYVHRIGRTGRAGQSGEAVTLVTPRERRQLGYIEHGIHRKLQPLRLPTPADLAGRRREQFRRELLEILDAGELDPFIAIVEDLATTRDPTELAAAAFKMASDRKPARERSAAASSALPRPAFTDRAPAAGGTFGSQRTDGGARPRADRTSVRPERTTRPAASDRPSRPASVDRSTAMPDNWSGPEWSPRGEGNKDRRPSTSARDDSRTAPRGAPRLSGGDDDPTMHGGALRERPSSGAGAHAAPRPRRGRANESMSRLFLRIGKQHGVRPADLVGAIANEAGLAGDEIGDIELFDTFCFVDVPEARAEDVEAALNRTYIRGKSPKASLARPSQYGDDEAGASARERPYTASRKTEFARSGPPSSGPRRSSAAPAARTKRSDGKTYPPRGPRPDSGRPPEKGFKRG